MGSICFTLVSFLIPLWFIQLVFQNIHVFLNPPFSRRLLLSNLLNPANLFYITICQADIFAGASQGGHFVAATIRKGRNLKFVVVVGGCVVKCLYGDHVLLRNLGNCKDKCSGKPLLRRYRHVLLIGIRKFNHHAIYCRELIYVDRLWLLDWCSLILNKVYVLNTQ